MLRNKAKTLGIAALTLAASIVAAQAQSAAYFAQLERDKVKCDNAGKVWDGRRCQSKGFFNAALNCKEGYKPVNGTCQKIHKPWNKPGCAGWKSACNAGNASACGKYESKCQVN